MTISRASFALRIFQSIIQDIFLHNPDVHWDDIIGLDSAKRFVKEAVVYPIAVSRQARSSVLDLYSM